MQATWYALRALAAEWQPMIGARLAAAYTQEAGTLRLAWTRGADAWTMHLHLRPVRLYRTEGDARRARRNTADVLAGAVGRTLRAICVPERDRVAFFDLDDGTTLQAVLYGPRANVLHVDAGGIVRDAFLRAPKLAGTLAPVPVPAPFPATPEALLARLGPPGPLAPRLARAMPSFDTLLSAEAVWRAGLAEVDTLTPDALVALHAAVSTLDAEAQKAPAPAVLEQDGTPVAVTLVALGHPHGLHPVPAPDADAALRTFHRRRLATEAFTRRRGALLSRLDAALARAAQREAAMLDALAQPTRADRYEQDAHLLLAAAHAVPPGAAEAAVPDLYHGGQRTLALDPALSAAENAERLYTRARRTREARRHAEARFESALDARAALDALLAEARALPDLDALEAFLTREDARLERLLRETGPGEGVREPFHRVPLGFGYEAWVGRSAQDNDALTLRHARPFDLWLHARGVTGSHVVLRLPGRTATAPKPVVERAAELAAYYSKARTSSLVPVSVTARKYVRKRRGSPPGSVVVEREEVLLVAPRAAEAETSW